MGTEHGQTTSLSRHSQATGARWGALLPVLLTALAGCGLEHRSLDARATADSREQSHQARTDAWPTTDGMPLEPDGGSVDAEAVDPDGGPGPDLGGNVDTAEDAGGDTDLGSASDTGGPDASPDGGPADHASAVPTIGRVSTSGDGWTTCGLGHRHWGLFGAAGLLVLNLILWATCYALLKSGWKLKA